MEDDKTTKTSKKVKRLRTSQVGTTSATEDVAQQVTTTEAENGVEDLENGSFLKGFESSGEEDLPNSEQYVEGQVIPGLPEGKEMQKNLKKLENKESDEPGVVYVG